MTFEELAAKAEEHGLTLTRQPGFATLYTLRNAKGTFMAANIRPEKVAETIDHHDYVQAEKAAARLKKLTDYTKAETPTVWEMWKAAIDAKRESEQETVYAGTYGRMSGKTSFLESLTATVTWPATSIVTAVLLGGPLHGRPMSMSEPLNPQFFYDERTPGFFHPAPEYLPVVRTRHTYTLARDVHLSNDRPAYVYTGCERQ